MTEYRIAKGRFEYVLKKLPTHLRKRPQEKLRKVLSRKIEEISILLTQRIHVKRIRQGGNHFSWFGGAEKVLQKRGAISPHKGQNFSDDYLTLRGAESALLKASGRICALDDTMPPLFREDKFHHFLA